MESILLYCQTLYIPLNIRVSELLLICDAKGITYEKNHITRVYTFYSPNESDIRYIRTRNLLKPITI